MSCPSEYRLDDYWLAGLAATHPVHEHAVTCAACQTRLDSYRAQEQLFVSELLPAAQPALLAAADAQLSQPAASRPDRSSGWSRLGYLLAGVTFAAGLAGIVLLPVDDPQTEAPYIGTKGDLDLRLFYKRGEDVHELQPGDTLFPGDMLRFVPAAPQAGYLMILSVDADGTIDFFYPSNDDAALPTSGAAEPLPGSIVLDNSAGPERIFLLFALHPFDTAQVRQAVRTAWQASGSVEALDELPLPMQQRTALFFKEGR